MGSISNLFSFWILLLEACRNKRGQYLYCSLSKLARNLFQGPYIFYLRTVHVPRSLKRLDSILLKLKMGTNLLMQETKCPFVNTVCQHFLSLLTHDGRMTYIHSLQSLKVHFRTRFLFLQHMFLDPLK